LFHAELVRAAEVIVTREGVAGLLSYTARAVLTTRQKRAYGGCPARQETDVSFVIEVQRDDGVIGEKKRAMGWQVYGTNGVGMSLPQVVWAYRGQYRIEDDWSRLKGRPLGLTPLYLQNEGRIQGLVYLLSLALRVLTLVEWVVRERLREDGSKMQGIYAGQAGRKTARPSAELLLEAMKTISVSVVEVNGQTHALLSPLTEVQKRLLELWGLPPDLYENVARGFTRGDFDRRLQAGGARPFGVPAVTRAGVDSTASTRSAGSKLRPRRQRPWRSGGWHARSSATRSAWCKATRRCSPKTTAWSSS